MGDNVSWSSQISVHAVAKLYDRNLQLYSGTD